MEVAIGSSRLQFEAEDATDAEEDLGTAGCVDGAVADDDEVGFDIGAVLPDKGGHLGAANFFFAFEEEFDVTGEGVMAGQ